LAQTAAQFGIVRHVSSFDRKLIEVSPAKTVKSVSHDLRLAACRVHHGHCRSRHRLDRGNAEVFLFSGIAVGFKSVSGRVPVDCCLPIKLAQVFSGRVEVKEDGKTLRTAYE
jgi:hypothetical protein